ncbi:hypothetical protein J5U23_02045 [Saccharolobus shibatae B12]|uniref:Uncharacterized protein n=2 Tax=Saccharolobus shibatae TaxID=2286 RepID=A0A8F5GTU4_SACSH|nr:hypothetical protein J5U23_02045 [Saccharolobus shibatae B12]QXJ35501.1 hypothetical protein J5U22_02048 [Saccharolobus shibatae]
MKYYNYNNFSFLLDSKNGTYLSDERVIINVNISNIWKLLSTLEME